MTPREQAIEAAKVIEMVEQLDKLEERYELIFDELAPLPGNRSAFTKASVSLVLDARERYHDSLAEAWPTIRELLLRDARARLDGAKMMPIKWPPADHPHCQAGRDGECFWPHCPQAVDHKTTCPLYDPSREGD